MISYNMKFTNDGGVIHIQAPDVNTLVMGICCCSSKKNVPPNDLFQKLFTSSGYCHSLVLQMSQGGQEKACNMIIVSCNGLTLKKGWS